MISPTYNFAAINTPTPQAPSIQSLIANCGNPGTAFSSSSLNQGDTSALITKINQNALRSDLVATYGGAGYGILWGLTITTSGGSLNAIINPGQGSCNGIVEVPNQVFVTCPTNATRCNIWLQANSTPTFVNTFLTPPSTACIYLGSVTTSASAITGIDYSGVIALHANQLFRQTADVLQPGDTPPSNIRLTTLTNYGIWDWDGNLHRQRVDPNSMVFTSNGPQFMNTHLQYSATTYTGSGTVYLTNSSPNIQRITPTAALVVVLPTSGSAINFGQWFDIYNDSPSSGGHNITLKDYTQTVSLYTITPQTSQSVTPDNISGNPAWPAPGLPVPPIGPT